MMFKRGSLTKEAMPFFTSSIRANTIRGIIMMSQDKDEAMGQMKRRGFKLQWRQGMWDRYGNYVNKPNGPVPFATADVSLRYPLFGAKVVPPVVTPSKQTVDLTLETVGIEDSEKITVHHDELIWVNGGTIVPSATFPNDNHVYKYTGPDVHRVAFNTTATQWTDMGAFDAATYDASGATQLILSIDTKKTIGYIPANESIMAPAAIPAVMFLTAPGDDDDANFAQYTALSRDYVDTLAVFAKNKGRYLVGIYELDGTDATKLLSKAIVVATDAKGEGEWFKANIHQTLTAGKKYLVAVSTSEEIPLVNHTTATNTSFVDFTSVGKGLPDTVSNVAGTQASSAGVYFKVRHPRNHA